MNQHPIPQNISTYKFRLIGDMTVKQFLLVAIGIGAAVLLYTSNLFSLFKFPLIFLAVIIGVGMAFFTIDGRPMETWLKAYLRAIYAPTQFIWRKHPLVPAFFSYTPSPTTLPAQTQDALNAAVVRKQAGLTSFLQTLPEYQLNTRLNQLESSQLSTISQLFAGNPLQYSPQSTADQPFSSAPPVTPPSNPNPTTQLHINNLSGPQIAPPTSTPTSVDKPRFQPTITGVVASPEIQIITEDKPKNSSSISGTINLNPPPTITVSTPQPTTAAPTPPPASLNTPSTIAITDSHLPFPSTPSTSNTAVGMVLDRDNKIIENAIIEIRDPSGIPVRATKTNKLGQFISTTPLKNGTYQLEVEKSGFSFDIIKLELTGQILDPLKIQAK